MDVAHIIARLEIIDDGWVPSVVDPTAEVLIIGGDIRGWRANCELCGRLYYSPGPPGQFGKASDGSMAWIHACPLCEDAVRSTWNITKPKGIK